MNTDTVIKESGARKIKTEEKLEIVKSILEDKKAVDIEVIDVSRRTIMSDFFVICSGTSEIHMKSLVDALLKDGKSLGLKKDNVEGRTATRWILVDYGDIVVHIFDIEERDYYDLESLWKDTVNRLEET